MAAEIRGRNIPIVRMGTGGHSGSAERSEGWEGWQRFFDLQKTSSSHMPPFPLMAKGELNVSPSIGNDSTTGSTNADPSIIRASIARLSASTLPSNASNFSWLIVTPFITATLPYLFRSGRQVPFGTFKIARGGNRVKPGGALRLDIRKQRV
jgi:hypothetical protein